MSLVHPFLNGLLTLFFSLSPESPHRLSVLVFKELFLALRSVTLCLATTEMHYRDLILCVKGFFKKIFDFMQSPDLSVIS